MRVLAMPLIVSVLRANLTDRSVGREQALTAHRGVRQVWAQHANLAAKVAANNRCNKTLTQRSNEAHTGFANLPSSAPVRNARSTTGRGSLR